MALKFRGRRRRWWWWLKLCVVARSTAISFYLNILLLLQKLVNHHKLQNCSRLSRVRGSSSFCCRSISRQCPLSPESLIRASHSIPSHPISSYSIPSIDGRGSASSLPLSLSPAFCQFCPPSVSTVFSLYLAFLALFFHSILWLSFSFSFSFSCSLATSLLC